MLYIICSWGDLNKDKRFAKDLNQISSKQQVKWNRPENQ